MGKKKRKQKNPLRILRTEKRLAQKAASVRAAHRRQDKRKQLEAELLKVLAAYAAEGKEADGRAAQLPEHWDDENNGNFALTADSFGLRRLYGGAAKFLVPRSGWADASIETRFDAHPYINAIRGGFAYWTTANLTTLAPDRIAAMRGLAKHVSGNRLTVREAKTKLTELRRDVVRRLKKLKSKMHPKPQQGLITFDHALKRKYYPPVGRTLGGSMQEHL